MFEKVLINRPYWLVQPSDIPRSTNASSTIPQGETITKIYAYTIYTKKQPYLDSNELVHVNLFCDSEFHAYAIIGQILNRSVPHLYLT